MKGCFIAHRKKNQASPVNEEPFHCPSQEKPSFTGK